MAEHNIEHGFIIIADISGYTKFLAETEIDHAQGILEDLFGVVVPALREPLAICGFQGDAVSAYAIDSDLVSGQFMLDCAERIYGMFADQREKIRINTTCPCKACAHVSELDLKIIIHAGEFVVQRTEGRDELAGRDVITAFRLLKNGVRDEKKLNAYTLITCDALERMGLRDYFAEDAFMAEDIEHIGPVEYVVHPLIDGWLAQRDAKRIFVAPDDDLVFPELTATVPIGPDAAFKLVSDPKLRTQWLEVESTKITNDQGGRIGPQTTMHCHHGGDQITVMEIVDWRPGKYLTIETKLPFGATIVTTHELVAVGEGTVIKVRVLTPKFKGLVGKILSPFIIAKIRKILGQEALPKALRVLEDMGQSLHLQASQRTGPSGSQAAQLNVAGAPAFQFAG